MDNIRWKFELIIQGVDEEAADRILNFLATTVKGYGGKMSGGFIPDDSGEGKDGKEDTERVQNG